MTPLSDALTAAQRRGLAALEKAFVAERIDSEAFHIQLHAMGITDDIDISYLATSLAVCREWGAPVPAEPSNGKFADDAASEKQKQLIADLCERKNQPIPAAVGTKADASKIIDELQAGTYDPAKWSVPF